MLSFHFWIFNYTKNTVSYKFKTKKKVILGGGAGIWNE